MSDPFLKYNAIVNLALRQRDRALSLNQRRGLVISGSTEWCSAIANKIACHFEQQVWVSRRPPKAVESFAGREVLQRLGDEVDLLVYDCHDGLDVDAFGAASGLIRGGGLLLLLTPPLAVWPQLNDPEAERFFKNDSASSLFVRRFIDIAENSEAMMMVAENSAIPNLSESNQFNSPLNDRYAPCRTQDQQMAVAAIVAVGSDAARPPLVLVSDRGRGKSSALGIAAAQLLMQGCEKILVTAPRLASVEALFEHARRLLPQGLYRRGLLQYEGCFLKFIAPDELIAMEFEADLLLVDEAAAIPVPMLEKMLLRCQRLVFATTVHGYEGTGRGFALRFNKVLDIQTPGWQQLRMQQPIRWAEGDLLEQFVFDALLLNATIASEYELSGFDPSSCQIVAINSVDLLRDPKLLSEVFGLLVLAHYRTRPNDLRQLLDSPGLQLFIMSYQEHVVAVALLGVEGGFNEPLAKLIYQGKRRLQGHLIPQSLATHAGFVKAPMLRCLRVMRIAVHPLVQTQGLGSALINHVYESVTEDSCDCLGASFGLTSELLSFWQSLSFVPVRLGLSREHSSGTHSLIMLRAVSHAGQCFVEKAHLRLQQQLPTLLAGPLFEFDAQLAKILRADVFENRAVMDELDWQDVVSFAYGLRGYEVCMAAIILFCETLPNNLPELDARQSQLLAAKVVGMRGWPEVVESIGLSGRADTVRLLREIVKLLLENYCDEKLLTSVRVSLDL